MAKFLFVYRGNPDAHGQDDARGDAAAHAEVGHLDRPRDAEGLDARPRRRPEAGGPGRHAKKVVTDGPFVESKEIVGGYSIVQADTIDAAAELAKGCPGLLVGGKVEVRPLAGYRQP